MITPGSLLNILPTRLPRTLIRNALHKRNTRLFLFPPSGVVLRTRLAIVKGQVVKRADTEFAIHARHEVCGGIIVDLARGAAAAKTVVEVWQRRGRGCRNYLKISTRTSR
jgi:hypothetical protein